MDTALEVVSTEKVQLLSGLLQTLHLSEEEEWVHLEEEDMEERLLSLEEELLHPTLRMVELPHRITLEDELQLQICLEEELPLLEVRLGEELHREQEEHSILQEEHRILGLPILVLLSIDQVKTTLSTLLLELLSTLVWAELKLDLQERHRTLTTLLLHQE